MSYSGLTLLRIILKIRSALPGALALACALALQAVISPARAGADAASGHAVTTKPAAEDDRDRNVHRAVGLLDYLAADYAGAVENGTVVNAEEYAEQKSFAEEVVALAVELDAGDVAAPITKLARAVDSRIQQLASADLVRSVTREARSALLQKFDIRLAPEAAPDIARGLELYRANCAVCHGERGDAATPKAAELKPPPLSFLGEKGRDAVSPYHVFNVTTFGIAGTAMASFDVLPARDRWNLAFYISALRHGDAGPGAAPEGLPRLSLHELSNSSDATLEERLAALGRPRDSIQKDIAYLRMNPAGAVVESGGRLGRARADIVAMLELYRNGSHDEARRRAFDIYLRDVEPVEARLRAADSRLVSAIEAGFVHLRADMRDGAGAAQVARTAEALDARLVEAESLLLQKEGSASFAFFASAFILLREGIEAVLLIAAMLGLLRKMGRPEAARSLHLGWATALAAGVATWIFARSIIQITAAGRELVEGITGLLASATLAYTSYWILSRADSKRWLDFLKAQMAAAISTKGRTALFGLAFLAVYREAFETVLFYEALLKDNAGFTSAIAMGAGVGALALLVAMVAIFKLSAKLPIRQFFTISGGFLYFLAFVFAGKGVHALIEGGYLDPRPIAMPALESIGIFADAQTLSLQVFFVAAVAVGLWVEYRGRRRALSA